jgi:VCBS repeat-containing protein
MATQTTGGGSTTSFTNTPQANGDTYNYIEDTLYNDATLYNRTTKTVYLDVMSNDLGGNAKTLFSVDDGGTGALSDLLKVETAWEQTADKNWIRVYNGKIEFKIGDGSSNIANARDVNSLDTDDSVDDTFVYAIRMANGTLAWATVHITITGENDGVELGTVTDASIDDTAANDVFSDITGTLTSTDPDASDTPTYSVVGGVATAESGFDVEVTTAYGTLYLNQSTGAYTFVADNAAVQALDSGDAPVALDFAVSVSDGDTSDGDTLTITINGANDAPVTGGDDSASGTEDDASIGGTVPTATDVDVETVTYQLVTGSVLVDGVAAPDGTVTLNADGSYSYTPTAGDQGLDDTESHVITFDYVASDGTANSDAATVTITINGANDAPELTATQATLDDGTEDNSYTVSEADLLQGFTDVDNGTVLAVTGLTADHGTAIQNLDGSWTITPDENYNGTVTLSYTVIDGDGGSVAGELTFDLAAVNDAAVIGGTDEGEVTEDADPNTASGTLTASDVDNTPNTFQASSGSTTYGSFVMGANGLWTYTLDNSNALVNNLVAGAFLMDSFIVQSEDGTMHTIDITIHGVDDGPIVVTPPPTETGADPNDFDNLTGGSVVSGNFTGSGNADTFTGDGGDQTLNGQGGNDTIYGQGGNDNINGNNDNDTLYGQAGSDTVSGNGGDDTLYGGSGVDSVTGNNENDVLYGGSGNDTLNGLNGDDILIGGYGADTLSGGGGNDTFKFLDVRDTYDTILDYMQSGTDFIDLSGIDADPSTVLNGTLGWGGTTPTAHGAWYEDTASGTVLYADTDGNAATAEFMVTLSGFHGWGTSYDTAAEGAPPGVTL